MSEIDDIERYCREHSRVYCYGAGFYGRTVAAFLHGDKIDIEGFVVSDLADVRYVLERRVYSLDEFKTIYTEDDGVIVSVGSRYRDEIIDSLEAKSICDHICVSEGLIPLLQEKGNYEHRYKTVNNISIMCYHRVVDIPLDTWKITVRKDLFERHLRYFKENYTILRSEGDWDLQDDIRGLIITFDDGYEDAYTNILPLLEKYEIPATFFICTGNLDTDNEFWWDELERIICFADRDIDCIDVFGEHIPIGTDEEKNRACYMIHPFLKKMDHKDRKIWLHKTAESLGSVKKREYCHSLSYDRLKTLASSKYVTIGGHTVTHSCLANEDNEMQKWEIEESKKQIEDIIGKSIEVFSYPFGQRDDFTDDTVRIAEQAGYKRIFTAYAGVAGKSSRNGYIPRINIGKETDYEHGIRKLSLYENIYGDEMI